MPRTKESVYISFILLIYLTSKFKTTVGFTVGTRFLTGEVCKYYEALSNRRLTVQEQEPKLYSNREKGKAVLETFPVLLN